MELPAAFLIRRSLGRAPTLDPRLKIYAVDENTIASLGLEIVPLAAWAALVDAIQKHKPAAILIDKVFGQLAAPPNTIEAFAASLAGGTPVTAAASVFNDSFVRREPYVADPPEAYSQLRNLAQTKGHFSGPDKRIRHAFAHVGHASFLPEGDVEPVLRSSDQTSLPIWSLFGAGPLRVENGQLVTPTGIIPVDRNGRLLANFPDERLLFSSIHSLAPAFQSVRRGGPFGGIEPGDIVVILSQFHVGQLPLIGSPVGEIPAAIPPVVALNSALTGRWLTSVSGSWMTIPVAAAAAGMTLWSLPFGALFLLLAAGFFAIPVIGIVSFVWMGVVIPWVLPGLCLSTTSLLLYLERSRKDRQKAQQVRHSLEGMVDPRKLDELLLNPGRLDFTPSDQILTVMFADIVGFSQSAERHGPREVFSHLKAVMECLTPIIHSHGGIIDKTLGDGLLCYFGYGYGRGPSPEKDHARQAVLCALEMQREMLRRNGVSAAEGSPVYPLRIGVNTDEVYVGDLGGGGRIEFTVVGSGVNLAQRLETGCETYRVLISPSCRDRIGAAIPDTEPVPRLIRIKHHEDLINVYELNPFADDPKRLAEGCRLHQDYLGKERLETRWPVENPEPIRVQTGRDTGTLINFSPSGLCVRLGQYYGPGVLLSLTLSSSESEEVETFQGEIRWGRPDGRGTFLHGILLKETTPERLCRYLSLMQSWSASPKAPDKAA